MKDNLKTLDIKNPEIRYLRILVFGPGKTGKSSLIKSIQSIFLERMAIVAPVCQKVGPNKELRIHYIPNTNAEGFLHFAFFDIMGMEKGDSEGIHIEDLINALDGRITNGFMVIPAFPCTETDTSEKKKLTMNDRIHCLIIVISADTVSDISDGTINEMSKVREKAEKLGIPQVVVLTKIDKACPEVAKDLKLVYRSKTIKDKMEECRDKLGVPMNFIFPVRNYHEEIDLIDEVDELLLSALKHILNFAKDCAVMPPSATKAAKKMVSDRNNQADGQAASPDVSSL